MASQIMQDLARAFTAALAVTAMAGLAPVAAQQKTYADYEQFFDGTLLEGDYRSTFADDGVCESIQEVKKGNTDGLGHLWGFHVPAGAAHTFHVKTFLTDSGDGDNIRFRWSVDDVTYTPLLDYTVADSGTLKSAPLPADISGMLLIWMNDTNRQRGHQTFDTFSIDWMYVETTSYNDPPLAPSDLVADGNSSSTIMLGWIDNSTNEDGFRIERSPDGVTWSPAGVVGADVTTFQDEGLLPAATYHYLVYAFNASGDSPPSNASTTTREPGAFAVEMVRLGGGGELSHGFDLLGQPGLAFGGSYNVEAALWNGTAWEIDELRDGGPTSIDFAFSPAGVPSCTWGYGAVWFAEMAGASWTVEAAVDLGGYTSGTSLAYDPAGQPTIAFCRKRGSAKERGLHLARRVGSVWETERIAPTQSWWWLSLAFDPNGRPALTYGVDTDRNNMPDVLELARWNGSSWTFEVVEDGVHGYGWNSCLRFDPTTGSPAITHRGGQPTQVRFVRWNGAAWEAHVVAESGEGFDVDNGALAYDSLGVPHVGFQFWDWIAYPRGSVWHAVWNGASWDHELVDDEGRGDLCIRIGPGDRPTLSFLGWLAGKQGVMFAQK